MTHLYRCTPFYLVKYTVRTRRNSLVTKNSSWRNCSNRWFIFLHVPYLNRWRAYATKYLDQSVWKVSCISRAGWYSGKFNAVKLCQSSSWPFRHIETDIRKISIIWFYQWNRVTGSDDYRFRRTRQITVKPLLSSLFSKVSWMLLTFFRRGF
jgi:hypothetical protein